MTTKKLQTNFSAGEIVPAGNYRADLPMVANGAALMRNCKVLATGGVRRRPGLEACATVPDVRYQHIEYIFNTEQTYQLLFSATRVDIHDGVSGAFLMSLFGAPWTEPMIGQLSVQAWGDFIFVAHPQMRTVQLQRTGAVTFIMGFFQFDTDSTGASTKVFQPYYRFAKANITLQVTNIAGYTDDNGWIKGCTADLETTVDYFVPDHVGTILTIGDGQMEITEFVDPRHVRGVQRSAHMRIGLTLDPLTVQAGITVIFVYDPFNSFVATNNVVIMNATALGAATYNMVNGKHICTGTSPGGWYYNYVPEGAVVEAAAVGGGPNVKIYSLAFRTVDWKEQMYSAVRGWPGCVSAYQSRLVLAGGVEVPNRLNLSGVEAPFNFDVGSGLDDESVQVGLSGKRTPIIRQVVGADHLQIFTSEGEYYVPRPDSNASITPGNISVLPQSTLGVAVGIRACEFDGATLFVSKNAQSLRQFVFGSNDTGYASPNLSFTASHLLRGPQSLAVQIEDADYPEATAFIVNADGTMAVFTMIRSEKIAAWGLWEGGFVSSCAVDGRAFFVVRRTVAGTVVAQLEKLDYGRLLDGSQIGSYVGRDGQNYLWGGFMRYAGQPIVLVVDGLSDIGLYVPDSSGRVSIPVRAGTLEGGFGIVPRLRTMNPEMVLQNGPTLGEMRRVVRSTVRLENTLGAALLTSAGRTTRFLNTRSQEDLGLPARPVNGLVEAWNLGWDDAGQVEIVQPSNGPMTVLAVNLDVEW